ncbi:unnamed protein product [Miscanthus lutarioriparius]|uniref:Uncharacterized protein n=1 Tax=Miscanthus lutarioriparius TaxID=422564 RepID=A0A811QCW2_9POAL|nr:unnamed protein product [Miscanthus lutarioriparius]
MQHSTRRQEHAAAAATATAQQPDSSQCAQPEKPRSGGSRCATLGLVAPAAATRGWWTVTGKLRRGAQGRDRVGSRCAALEENAALHPAARACSGNGDGTATRQWPVRATRSTVTPCDRSPTKSEQQRARERGDKGSGASKPWCKTRQWALGDGKAASKGFNGGGGRALHRRRDPKRACVRLGARAEAAACRCETGRYLRAGRRGQHANWHSGGELGGCAVSGSEQGPGWGGSGGRRT